MVVQGKVREVVRPCILLWATAFYPNWSILSRGNDDCIYYENIIIVVMWRMDCRGFKETVNRPRSRPGRS